MKLCDLLHEVEYRHVLGNGRAEITNVCYDSNNVVPGSLFVCLKGAREDGHDYVPEAIEKGAVAIVKNQDSKITVRKKINIIEVQDTRVALAQISGAFFGYPAMKLQTIGITGTKGKTTTAYLIKSILEHGGYRVGLIGTIEIIIGQKHIPANNTTPESYLIQKYLSQMVEEGIQVVVMEVSSQGLKFHRTGGILFDYGIFTNLGEDHIGPNEHKDQEEYIECKSKLFRQCRVGIINCDDPLWRQVTRNHTCVIETYGFTQEAQVRSVKEELIQKDGIPGISFEVAGKSHMQVQMSVPGKFNIYNGLAAIAVSGHFKITLDQIKEALWNTKVRGRMEPIPISDEFTLFIDYAHNAMSLESLLLMLKEYQPKRLVCLFGCGGNRSKIRRYEMGEISGKLADLTIITSDNPREEDPQDIMEDIVKGIKLTKGAYKAICNRKEAIAYAIDHAQAGDIIILAGKGHEDYQEIKGIKYPMDERIIIQEILQERETTKE